MEQEDEKGVKNPPIGRAKGMSQTEFSDCCIKTVVNATAKGEKFKYCKCGRKINKKEVKNDARLEKFRVS